MSSKQSSLPTTNIKPACHLIHLRLSAAASAGGTPAAAASFPFANMWHQGAVFRNASGGKNLEKNGCLQGNQTTDHHDESSGLGIFSRGMQWDSKIPF